MANVDTLAPAKGVDLSSVPKIKSYLRSLGIDPSRAVIQRGVRNYAGPNCPGFAWNCTAARGVVVQMAQTGQNKFECTPSDEGTADPETNMCVVVQTNTGGKNQATCRESSDAKPATLTCDIRQSNDTGDNHATIDQNVKQVGGATQDATLIARLDQDNDAGSNHAGVTQTISQSTSSVLDLMQSQDADFTADVVQDTDAGGNNHLQQSQTLNQDGRASGSSFIVQEQTADHLGQVDQEVGPDDSYGSFLRLAGVALLQQEGEGFSKAHAIQFERQTLKGPGEQSQFGPMNCCGAASQDGSPAQTHFNIHQDSAQKASRGSAEQFLHLDGSCKSSGTCSIDHKAKNDEDHITVHESRDVLPIFVHTTCDSTDGESSGGCTSSTTTFDPDPPEEG